ncbi:MAG: hypothetical protein AAB922_02155 [Patescibacteria group bacterium]
MPDIAAIQKAISEKRQDIGQRYADMPALESKTRADLFGNDATTNSLRANETAKIKELYDHDKRLADNYANKESPSYMADPYAREKAVAMQSQATAGELSTIQGQIGQRRDILGDALEKAMKLLSYGLEASKFEYSGLQDELDTAMKLQDKEDAKKEKAGGALAKQKKDAQIAQAIQYLLSQSGNRGEAMQDVAAMAGKNPDSAQEILGLLDLFPENKDTGLSAKDWELLRGGGGGEVAAAKPVKLVDPKTRQIVEYDGVNDKDYFDDLQKGYIPY